MIRLFPATETSFLTMGLGPLSDAISCHVIEERNGAYELIMKYPITGSRYSDLAEERLIYTKPAEGEIAQPFRIYKITRPINGVVTVYAEHISYELSRCVVSAGISASSISGALTTIKNHVYPANNFTFWTDKTTTANWGLKEPRNVRNCLAGQEGSILDVYGGGDLKWNRWRVEIYANRGEDRGCKFIYGKNITDIEKESDMTNVYTGIYPYWKDEENDTVYQLPSSDPIVYSSHSSDYTYPRVITKDCTDQFDNTLSYNQMCTKIRNYCASYLTNNKPWELYANIRVKGIPLKWADEYKDNSWIADCKLCDTVTVKYQALGINIKSKIIKVDYDVLLGMNSEIEIGTKKETLDRVIYEIARRAK